FETMQRLVLTKLDSSQIVNVLMRYQATPHRGHLLFRRASRLTVHVDKVFHRLLDKRFASSQLATSPTNPTAHYPLQGHARLLFETSGGSVIAENIPIQHQLKVQILAGVIPW